MSRSRPAHVSDATRLRAIAATDRAHAGACRIGTAQRACKNARARLRSVDVALGGGPRHHSPIRHFAAAIRGRGVAASARAFAGRDTDASRAAVVDALRDHCAIAEGVA